MKFRISNFGFWLKKKMKFRISNFGFWLKKKNNLNEIYIFFINRIKIFKIYLY